MESGHEPPTIPMVTCPKGPQSKGIIVIMTSDPDSKNRKKKYWTLSKNYREKKRGKNFDQFFHRGAGIISSNPTRKLDLKDY